MTYLQTDAPEAEIAPVPDWLKPKYVMDRMPEVLPDVTSPTTVRKLAAIVNSRMIERWVAGEITDGDQLREAIDAELRKYLDRAAPSSNSKLSVPSIVSILRDAGQEVDQAILDQAKLRMVFGSQIRLILREHPDFALESIIPVGVVRDNASEIAGAAEEILLTRDGVPKQNSDGTWKVPRWIPDDQIQQVIDQVVAEEKYKKTIEPPNVRGKLTVEKGRDIGDFIIRSTVERLLAHANARPDDHQPPGTTQRQRWGKRNTHS